MPTMEMLESYRPGNVKYLKGDSSAITDNQVVRENFRIFRKFLISIAEPAMKVKIEEEFEMDGIDWMLKTTCRNATAEMQFKCQTGKCEECCITDEWLFDYILERFHIDLSKWSDYPLKYIDFDMRELSTKSNSSWSFPVRVSDITVLLDWADRFENKLFQVRPDTFDALCQQKTHSLWISDNQCVPNFNLSSFYTMFRRFVRFENWMLSYW